MSARIVLIGAGSAQFGCGTLGDVFQSEILSNSEIVLHDINPEALKKMKNKAQDFIAGKNLPFTITSTLDRSAALKGADFIIISIEVGDRFSLWDMDRTIPQHYGIRQLFGENGGPGGLFHSLRIIPPILDICEDVANVCPDAYIFNYSNPMSRICTTVHRRYPDLKFIGLCHEIASLNEHLPSILSTPKENIEYRAGGLNHFSILVDARYKDSRKDAYTDIREKAPEYFSKRSGSSELWKFARENLGDLMISGEVSQEMLMQRIGQALERLIPEDSRTGNIMSALQTEGFSNFNIMDFLTPLKKWSERTLFKEIFEKFNYLPITGDSHFGEYIPWAYEVADHKGILDFYAYYRTYLSLIEPGIELDLEERVVPIMEGILTNSGYEEAAVNIPNEGYIKNLPDWLSVEVPAIVDSRGIHGISLDMPSGIGGLLSNQIGVHDLTAEAILRQSKDLVIQALLVDPVVDKCANIPDMVDFMIENQSPFLDYLK
jgi:alpha-galactosidase